MDSTKRMTALALALALPAVAAALDIEPRLVPPPPRSPLGPAVCVTFEDARPATDGGGDLRSLGKLRSSATTPVDLRSGTVDALILGWVSDGLRAAGYDPRPGPDPALPRVHVVLRELMAYGVAHVDVPLVVELAVTPPGAADPSWTTRLDLRGGVVLEQGVADIVRGYEDAFAQGYAAMARHFDGAPFQAAAGGPPVAGAAAAATVAVTVNVDGVPAASGAVPLAIPVAGPPAPPVSDDEVRVAAVTAASAGEATAALAALCVGSFDLAFTFESATDEGEWTISLVDEEGERVGYVNLDDEDTVEVNESDEDFDCDTCEAGREHRARIRLADEEVRVVVDGEEVVEDEDVEVDDDECVVLEIAVDDGVRLRDLVLERRR